MIKEKSAGPNFKGSALQRFNLIKQIISRLVISKSKFTCISINNSNHWGQKRQKCIRNIAKANIHHILNID
jgi:hypothetical protein